MRRLRLESRSPTMSWKRFVRAKICRRAQQTVRALAAIITSTRYGRETRASRVSVVAPFLLHPRWSTQYSASCVRTNLTQRDVSCAHLRSHRGHRFIPQWQWLGRSPLSENSARSYYAWVDLLSPFRFTWVRAACPPPPPSRPPFHATTTRPILSRKLVLGANIAGNGSFQFIF